MQPLTAEWVARAEEDFAVASREFQRTEDAAYNVVCFHSQQAAEKYLKAVLQEANAQVPRTHDLPFLVKLIKPYPQEFHALREAMASLSQLAVVARYPGYSANKRTATEAMATAEAIRRLCKSLLGSG